MSVSLQHSKQIIGKLRLLGILGLNVIGMVNGNPNHCRHTFLAF